VSTSEHYRHSAVDCLRLAQLTDDPQSKALYIAMAQAWVRLADMVAGTHYEFAPQPSLVPNLPTRH
jgi:hypothetical protein